MEIPIQEMLNFILEGTIIHDEKKPSFHELGLGPEMELTLANYCAEIHKELIYNY